MSRLAPCLMLLVLAPLFCTAYQTLNPPPLGQGTTYIARFHVVCGWRYMTLESRVYPYFHILSDDQARRWFDARWDTRDWQTSPAFLRSQP